MAELMKEGVWKHDEYVMFTWTLESHAQELLSVCAISKASVRLIFSIISQETPCTAWPSFLLTTPWAWSGYYILSHYITCAQIFAPICSLDISTLAVESQSQFADSKQSVLTEFTEKNFVYEGYRFQFFSLRLWSSQWLSNMFHILSQF